MVNNFQISAYGLKKEESKNGLRIKVKPPWDEIFEIDGARYFREVSIGTNYKIQQATKNILFDEKIGGTMHMIIDQSYK